MSLQKKVLRQPIVVVLGHVDHGKTTLLDKIRGTAVVKKEPGEMTQEVGASLVPASVIEKVASPLKKIIPVKLEIPGLLFIDTPGHELFSNLRKRGGSVADIAILVIDVMEGFQNQTRESLEILRSRKVPFIIAANKIDRIQGWKPIPDSTFTESIRKQTRVVQEMLDKKVYDIVIQLSQLGLSSERFDRVTDFTKNVAIVPVSGRTGEGIPELLAILAGLTQQYLKNRLKFAEGPGKGVVMEVKEEPGLGSTIDVIIYDGILRKNDTIVLAGLQGPIVTKVKSILVPKPLQDMKMKAEYTPLDEVYAATGVKVSAHGLDEAVAGSPILVAEKEQDIEIAKKTIEEEIASVRITSSTSGVVVKADSLGALEAIVQALNYDKVPIRIADIGPVTKRDVLEAQLSAQENPELGAILAFKVKVLQGVETSHIKLIQSNIIYQLLEEYKRWVEQLREEAKRRNINSITLPAKFRILPGNVFRRSDPVVVGVEVLGGILRPKAFVINISGKRVGEIQQIQNNKKVLEKLSKGETAAISIKGNIMVGRHVEEGETLYTDLTERDIEVLLKDYRSEVTQDMLDIIKEIINIKRKENALFALAIQALVK